MSQFTTQARPYAKAAFEVALSADNLAGWSQMLSVLGAVVRHETVERFLASPSLSAEQQAQAVIDVCGDALSEQGQNFVKLLAENKRLALLPEVSVLFEALKANQERSIDVDVVTAFEMTDSVQEKLTQALKQRLQREVNISASVDKSLIGGMVVHAGDLVIDGSIRGRLNKLAETMKA